MDLIDWCDFVLDKLIDMSTTSLDVRSYGANEWDIARALFGEAAVSRPEFHSSKARLGILDALEELNCVRLIEGQGGGFYKPTPAGEQLATDKTPLWEAICNIALKPEQEELLKLVNRLSPRVASDHAWLEWTEQDTLLSELGWKDGVDVLLAVAKELGDQVLVDTHIALGPHIELKAKYNGLVWELRRGLTLESAFIDRLLTEWETTSVEFKRQLETRTADQKAELVKDVIALANTQASGSRWLIIGFDDKTRSYFGPPDAKTTNEHLEQLMSQYTEPVVDIRYDAAQYRLGPVGRLEVIRDPKKLPYRVRKPIGDKKRIEAVDIYVRHGSLTEQPTEAEREAIECEGDLAKSEEV